MAIIRLQLGTDTKPHIIKPETVQVAARIPRNTPEYFRAGNNMFRVHPFFVDLKKRQANCSVTVSSERDMIHDFYVNGGIGIVKYDTNKNGTLCARLDNVSPGGIVTVSLFIDGKAATFRENFAFGREAVFKPTIEGNKYSFAVLSFFGNGRANVIINCNGVPLFYRTLQKGAVYSCEGAVLKCHAVDMKNGEVFVEFYPSRNNRLVEAISYHGK